MLNRAHNKKSRAIFKQQEQHQKQQEEYNYDSMVSKDMEGKNNEKPKKTKQKVDVFQQVFESITKIIQEL